MRCRVALAGGLAAVALSACSTQADPPAPEPPAVPSVVLDDRVPGWRTSAWLTDDSFCVRTARTERAAGQANETVLCDPAPAELNRPGPPVIPAKPLPQVSPLDPDQRDVLLVGTVRGAVAEVSVTMFGRTSTAAVHPLPVTGGRRVGAYAVWLPRAAAGRPGMTLTDIDSVVGRDATGAVVTRLD